MQFRRTKRAERQLEASKVKFWRMRNFFTFCEAERPGQRQSDPFTTDERCAPSMTVQNHHGRFNTVFFWNTRTVARVLHRAHVDPDGDDYEVT